MSSLGPVSASRPLPAAPADFRSSPGFLVDLILAPNEALGQENSNDFVRLFEGTAGRC